MTVSSSSCSSSTWMLAMITLVPTLSSSGSLAGLKSSSPGYSSLLKVSAGSPMSSDEVGSSASVSAPILCRQVDVGVFGHSLDPL